MNCLSDCADDLVNTLDAKLDKLDKVEYILLTECEVGFSKADADYLISMNALADASRASGGALFQAAATEGIKAGIEDVAPGVIAGQMEEIIHYNHTGKMTNLQKFQLLKMLRTRALLIGRSLGPLGAGVEVVRKLERGELEGAIGAGLTWGAVSGGMWAGSKACPLGRHSYRDVWRRDLDGLLLHPGPHRPPDPRLGRPSCTRHRLSGPIQATD